MNFDHYAAARSKVKFSRCFQSCRSFTSRYKTEIMWRNRNNHYFVVVGFVTELVTHSTTRRNEDFGECLPLRFHSLERGSQKRTAQPRHYLCNRIIHNAYRLLIFRIFKWNLDLRSITTLSAQDMRTEKIMTSCIYEGKGCFRPIVGSFEIIYTKSVSPRIAEATQLISSRKINVNDICIRKKIKKSLKLFL